MSARSILPSCKANNWEHVRMNGEYNLFADFLYFFSSVGDISCVWGEFGKISLKTTCIQIN